MPEPGLVEGVEAHRDRLTDRIGGKRPARIDLDRTRSVVATPLEPSEGGMRMIFAGSTTVPSTY
jgi:hypothetical protein